MIRFNHGFDHRIIRPQSSVFVQLNGRMQEREMRLAEEGMTRGIRGERDDKLICNTIINSSYFWK